MSLRNGTAAQKALFACFCLIYLAGVYVDVRDKAGRVGNPDTGWLLERNTIAPTRRDVSEAGLRGGGRPLSINGVECREEESNRRFPAAVRTGLGEVNTVVFRSATGEIREITAEVRIWRWEDAVFTEGATALIGLLLFLVGAGTFVLRPFEPTSWALLSFASVAGGLLMVTLVPLGDGDALDFTALYFFSVLGAMPAVTLHVALAFPILHPSIATLPHRVLPLIYASQPLLTVNYIGGWMMNWQSIWSQARISGATMLLLALTFFTGRCLQLAVWGDDRVVVQRARILLAGIVAGFAPVSLGYFLQEASGFIAIDNRFLQWPVLLFILALARVTLRHELLNARVAVRRAVMYASAVAILTGIAVLLSTVRTYAVAILLFPLLYLWPRFDSRLNARLYPNRSRFPEILREVSNRLAAAENTTEVLDALAHSAGRLSDAGSAVAFLLPHDNEPLQVVVTDPTRRNTLDGLENESVVKLLATLHTEVSRSDIAMEPRYGNIRAACQRGFDRLGAERLLPIERDGQVVGGLAVGPRASGDAYEAAEINALSMLVQQTAQALVRIAATDRLRAREREFAELNRFFSPQVIDQVMARGGAAKLRSQRKRVTVVFVDMRGFTSFSDTEEPEEVMATLAEYHAAMGARIAQFEGTLERFAGDGLMVFFNDPVEQPDHVSRAADMARAMLQDVALLRATWQERGYRIDVGIGIHTGFATCGFIGYEGRRDYGVIGNVTNLAARLSDAAGPGEILISSRVRAELGEETAAEPVGEIELKGFHQPQTVFRLSLT